ncbi:MAG: hypothetical protein IKP46_04460 [Bacteroidales bacterium]|nr:hypothetical protein [Bacteroidales bacterium]
MSQRLRRHGRQRGLSDFAGTNVYFVQILPGGSIKVRTFEKGVEGETLACGTGITASALASAFAALQPADAAWHIPVQARRDALAVDFVRDGAASFRHVFLTGPAELL